ncbi:unnamed protein product [Adineta ricciae]|uniref:Apple domain-containing protein n=1 Tax=Adineta ricciae TaxID=249248 RepID=A0A814PG86_ADIRI|nr:unnamed protein product [Adineta ricciae]
MSLSKKILIIVLLISNFNVHAYNRRHMKRLEQFLRGLQYEFNERTIHSKRLEPAGDCTADILEGYQWDGQDAMNVPGVDSHQVCMDNCDMNEKCMGWSYKANTRMCWGMHSITGVIAVPGVNSGSCVGQNLKAKCEEKKEGQYLSNTIKTLENIDTVEICMQRCDEEKLCFGWLYDEYGKNCYLASSLGEFQPGPGFLTGSCIATQKRIRLADPLKVFRKEILQRHNIKRKDHCVGDLALDDNLNTVSQQFAEKLAAADVTPPDYDATKMQAVYYGKGDIALNGAIVVDNFYNENKFYNYEKPDFSSTRHFPKIIWKSSSKLGVGRAFTVDRKSMFVVITYDSTDTLTDSSYQSNVQKKCS